jgi:hypothetical protein
MRVLGGPSAGTKTCCCLSSSASRNSNNTPSWCVGAVN